MDIKEKIDEIVAKVKNDGNFAASFKENPVKAVESVIGVDLPDDSINKVVDAVKAKISASDIAENITGKFGKLFK